MGHYARNTDVSMERSRVEIEKTIRKYGATGFFYAFEDTTAMLGFKIGGETIKLYIQLPDPDDEEFHTTETGRKRKANQAYQAWEQACRTAWRVQLLLIKAKLEAIETGETTVRREFMPDLVLPNGQRVQEALEPQLEKLSGKDVPLLPLGK